MKYFYYFFYDVCNIRIFSGRFVTFAKFFLYLFDKFVATNSLDAKEDYVEDLDKISKYPWERSVIPFREIFSFNKCV